MTMSKNVNNNKMCNNNVLLDCIQKCKNAGKKIKCCVLRMFATGAKRKCQIVSFHKSADFNLFISV